MTEEEKGATPASTLSRFENLLSVELWTETFFDCFKVWHVLLKGFLKQFSTVEGDFHLRFENNFLLWLSILLDERIIKAHVHTGSP